jgi:hypothetical protein
VGRVVHTSITCPDIASELPYFRGKAELEQALAATGLTHSILRPAILFGDTPQESILINNMAWSLRHLPAVATFGWGNYCLQPIHVQDFAELAMNEAERSEPSRIINATGMETYTFRELWSLLARSMGLWRPILPVPHAVGYMAARLLGALVGDGAQVGCHAVLNPGCILGRGSTVRPLSCVCGGVAAGACKTNRSAADPGAAAGNTLRLPFGNRTGRHRGAGAADRAEAVSL